MTNLNHPTRFDGVRVAITGGTSGLGLALVREFLARGARVAFVARTRTRVEDVVHTHPGSFGIVGDVSRKDDIHAIALQITANLGGLDVLINGASSLGPTLYMPVLQHPYQGNELQVVMRTPVSPASLIEPVRGKMRSLNPEVATRFTTMDAMVSSSIATPRLRMLLVGLFAGLALLLAMAGMYGVMTYVTVERIPDPSDSGFGALWESEWKENLLGRALENVKEHVTPKQFQLFDRRSGPIPDKRLEPLPRLRPRIDLRHGHLRNERHPGGGGGPPADRRVL